jgi:hypothetical protein
MTFKKRLVRNETSGMWRRSFQSCNVVNHILYTFKLTIFKKLIFSRLKWLHTKTNFRWNQWIEQSRTFILGFECTNILKLESHLFYTGAGLMFHILYCSWAGKVSHLLFSWAGALLLHIAGHVSYLLYMSRGGVPPVLHEQIWCHMFYVNRANVPPVLCELVGIPSVLNEQVRCLTCCTWTVQVSQLLHMSRAGVTPAVMSITVVPLVPQLYMIITDVPPVVHKQFQCPTFCMWEGDVSPRCTWSGQVRCSTWST